MSGRFGKRGVAVEGFGTTKPFDVIVHREPASERCGALYFENGTRWYTATIRCGHCNKEPDYHARVFITLLIAGSERQPQPQADGWVILRIRP